MPPGRHGFSKLSFRLIPRRRYRVEGENAILASYRRLRKMPRDTLLKGVFPTSFRRATLAFTPLRIRSVPSVSIDFNHSVRKAAGSDHPLCCEYETKS
jgi:hypothetical protein